jgi:hypothetical protein
MDRTARDEAIIQTLYEGVKMRLFWLQGADKQPRGRNAGLWIADSRRSYAETLPLPSLSHLRGHGLSIVILNVLSAASTNAAC